jgi:uncharacterized protein YbjT (DUF2867 family)
MPEQRTALLLGATGLVGGHCLNRLLADETYGSVVALSRRPLDRTHAKLANHVVDFDRYETYYSLLKVDDVFCCLGTTIKQAGSKEAFRRVDFEYPVQIAKRARAQGAQQYLLVSSLGASVSSPFFYSQVKGEVEQAVSALSFSGVYIFRPSLLRGERKEVRRGEQISEKVLDGLGFLLQGPLKKYRPTPADAVAAAMIATAKARPGGTQILESDEIEEVARRGSRVYGD